MHNFLVTNSGYQEPHSFCFVEKKSLCYLVILGSLWAYVIFYSLVPLSPPPPPVISMFSFCFVLFREFDVFTYLCNRSRWSMGHQRPPAIALWAALVIPDQLVPCCFSSASVSHLQLLQGWPLFLFPCGFQVRAWRVVLHAGFLRVCPIQPYFLRSICLATGSCPARSHRSSFRIFSCHWIL